MSFPTALAAIQDSSQFSETLLDNTITQELEGGYAHTRPRTTRAPRKEFTTGFTDITDAQKSSLETFFRVKGQHTSFVYTHPISADPYVVRFKSQLKFAYAGMGYTPRWNVKDIVLSEV